MENRSASRLRTVLKAEIRYNGGLMSAPCVVRDLSDTGARLELEGEVTLPDHFDLYIEKKHRTYPAIVKRRNGREVGVAFKDAKTERAADPELPDRITKLESEVAEIRRALAALTAAVTKQP